MANDQYSSVSQKAWTLSFRFLCGLIFLFLVAPIVVIIPLSFNSVPYFTYPMEGFSWRWYEEIFGSSTLGNQWRQAFVNSLMIGLSSTALATALGTLAAIGLDRMKGRLRAIIMAVFLSPMIVPLIVAALGMYYFYAQLGLVGSMLGVILAHTALGTPFVVITVLSTLSGFDINLFRAGLIMGARPFRVFRQVTLPIIAPGVVSGAIFAFVTSWDEIIVVLFMAGPGQHTIPRRMWSGLRELISPSIISAATILILFSIVILFVMHHLQKRGERLRGEFGATAAS